MYFEARKRFGFEIFHLSLCPGFITSIIVFVNRSNLLLQGLDTPRAGAVSGGHPELKGGRSQDSHQTTKRHKQTNIQT